VLPSIGRNNTFDVDLATGRLVPHDRLTATVA